MTKVLYDCDGTVDTSMMGLTILPPPNSTTTDSIFAVSTLWLLMDDCEEKSDYH